MSSSETVFPRSDTCASGSIGEPGITDLEQLEKNVAIQIGLLGEDIEREGLIKTPARVARALRFMTSGYTRSVEQVVNDAIYHEPGRDMVVVKDIAFYSLCEHHLLPFFGCAHIAYLPAGRVIGLSKIPRLVDLFARRLQLQERVTTQVADALEQVLQPEGVAVVLQAHHLCMMMRGVEEQRSRTITTCLRGTFESCESTRDKFFRFLPVPESRC
jgi:GTP cyclohydrolase IA